MGLKHKDTIRAEIDVENFVRANDREVGTSYIRDVLSRVGVGGVVTSALGIA